MFHTYQDRIQSNFTNDRVILVFHTKMGTNGLLSEIYSIKGMGSQPLMGSTIPMAQRARTETDPDHECMKFMATGYKTTFEKFENVTNNIAANLLASGLSPGDRIGIWSPNHLEWMETQFAAAKAGLILVNVNPSYTGTI